MDQTNNTNTADVKMDIINANVGKIGSYFIGPKHYLNKHIRLGEIIICIARDSSCAINPYIWLIGGAEQLIDYLSLARSKGSLDDTTSNLLLSKLDEAKTRIPKTAHARLASILSLEEADLTELIEIAQVSVTAPIGGVYDYSDFKPRWNSKTACFASIH